MNRSPSLTRRQALVGGAAGVGVTVLTGGPAGAVVPPWPPTSGPWVVNVRDAGAVPDWNPAGIRAMRYVRTSWDGTATPAWRIQLAGTTPGAELGYKLTLGDWPHVERTRDCAETTDRTVTLPASGTLWEYATVATWNGVTPCT